VDIVTSSFGVTKLVTLSPSMVIINKSTVGLKKYLFFLNDLFLCYKIGIDIVETVEDKEQDTWKSMEPEQVKDLF
jgi:hypothetical protein